MSSDQLSVDLGSSLIPRNSWVTVDDEYRDTFALEFARAVATFTEEDDLLIRRVGLTKSRFYLFDSLSSTMDAAVAEVKGEFLRGRVFEGFTALECFHGGVEQLSATNVRSVIISRSQVAGRGRYGREWKSVCDNGIYLSVVIHFPADAQLSGYSLCIGLALIEALESLHLRLGLKWPNDVFLFSDKEQLWGKLAGVLIEVSSDGDGNAYAIVGVGLNLKSSPEVKRCGGFALDDVVSGEIELTALYARIVLAIASYSELFFKDGFRYFQHAWNEHSIINGLRVNTRQGDVEESGTVLGVDELGGLVVKGNGYNYTVVAGEVVQLLDAPFVVRSDTTDREGNK